MPQWNCGCPNCRAAREGRMPQAAQCSLAFSPDAHGGNWYLVNATPDLPEQLFRWPELHPRDGIRATPVRGVILTDGELDHTMGLLHLREGARWELYATPTVIALLETQLAFLAVLRRYARVETRALSLGSPLRVGTAPAQVEMRLVESGDHAPRYAASPDGTSQGLVAAMLLRDVRTNRRLAYVPSAGRLSGTLRGELEGADVILFDGTFWTDDELPRLGIGARRARDMGHVPVGGADGSARWLSTVPAGLKLYVHLNNTNPLLDAGSPERAWIRGLGLDVASDGWEATL